MPMKTPEGKNVDYLKHRIHALGGLVRKCHWEGVRGAPDLLILLPHLHAWVEVKAAGQVPKPHQIREMQRLVNAGARVFVVASRGDIDWLVEIAIARSDIYGPVGENLRGFAFAPSFGLQCSCF